MVSTEQAQTPRNPASDYSLTTEAKMYDLVSIGFGPAQLATAIANRESKNPARVLYLERKPSFSWYPGAHTSRTRMENPFVYDLATVRNPRSAFTYVNYLLARKRLIEFANSDRLNPLRAEFEDYLKWCAEQFDGNVKYGSEVVEVLPEVESDVVTAWKVAVRDQSGNTSVVRARSVLAPSPSSNSATKPSQPLTSTDFLSGQRIIAMTDYLSKRNDLRDVHEPRLNIAIVGSGPQASEILDDLLTCPRLGNITIVTEDESLKPLQALHEQKSPQPRLCSIWAKPSGGKEESVGEASELVQTIYMRAYEKQVASRGQYGLRVVVGKEAAEACSKSDIIIRDTVTSPLASSEILQSLDTLVLGCRSRGDSLEEVLFKRGATADGCQVFLMSAHTEGGRSLAKDIAVMAGKVVGALLLEGVSRRDAVMVHARI
ncbi:L-lysine 6-monooxygenase (NADPH-requiring)-domain-containing protein [Paraphoma chrysanthemicola]|uniref:L-ornithine N(5)-monooxygenase [NAD(P)H] n=1 Tax=Paraphoma chrysanthemicola TaxID=798071 RepID=A0A8K0REW3_9PLEO|nr:L-lysine 6-monooxygenase (NADPH-requiring)-domain-containing protein [Paraphoma chrysanthemicola]